MDILVKEVSFTEKIKNSTFLSELLICNSQNEAREIIKAQKTKYDDARHVVHAFIVGNGAEICGMSDDGEPSGTAGRPVLDVLKGRNCTNCILTITRWFGGTLLGTGGLVQAYSTGAKQVIQKADEENAFSLLVSKTPFSFSCDYSSYNIIKNKLEPFNLFDISEIFGENITLKGFIQSDEFELLAQMLKNLSNGKILL